MRLTRSEWPANLCGATKHTLEGGPAEHRCPEEAGKSLAVLYAEIIV